MQKNNFKAKFPDAWLAINMAREHAKTAEDSIKSANELRLQAMCELRRELGINATLFGKLCGCSKAYIHMLEKGVRPWNSELISKAISAIESQP